MKSAVETLNPTRVRLTVEVPFEELKPSLDAAYKKIASQVNVPGFRKGKVPARIIDQRFGRAVVLEEAINATLPRLYTKAVVDNNVRALGQPEVDVKELADGELFTFTADVDIRPEFDVPAYAGIEITVEDADVTGAAIDAEVDALRERFASLATVERAATTGAYVSIDLSASLDGTEIDDAQAKGLSYEIGSGELLDGLDEAVTGLSAGESATFRTTMAGGDFDGQEVDVVATVNSVKEKSLPEPDDEFAMLASEYDTLEELREGVREQLERLAALRQATQARDRALDALITSVELPLPERVLANAVASRRHTLEHQLENAGIDIATALDREGKTEEDLTADFTEDAERGLRAEFILDSIADAENIAVSEAELADHIVRSAARYGMRPDDFAKEIVDAGQQITMVAEVRRGKALSAVVEAALVTDASGRTVDPISEAEETEAEEIEAEEIEAEDTEG